MIKRIARWLSVKLGNYVVEDLQTEVEVLNGLIDTLEESIAGLNAGYGVLHKKYESSLQNGMVTIASLLMASGGSIEVTNDAINAVSDSDFDISYDPTGESVKVGLVFKSVDDQPDESACVGEGCTNCL